MASTNDQHKRQLTVMLEQAESTNRATRDRRLAERHSFLVNLGVLDQSEANKVITEPDSPLLARLEREKEKANQESRDYNMKWTRR